MKFEAPENFKFYCEVCDRGFKVEEKYKAHCDSHKTVRDLVKLINLLY